MKLQTEECNLLIRSKIFSFQGFFGLWSAVPEAGIGRHPECSAFPYYVSIFAPVTEGSEQQGVEGDQRPPALPHPTGKGKCQGNISP